jgi:hypothetical protein
MGEVVVVKVTVVEVKEKVVVAAREKVAGIGWLKGVKGAESAFWVVVGLA